MILFLCVEVKVIGKGIRAPVSTPGLISNLPDCKYKPSSIIIRDTLLSTLGSLLTLLSEPPRLAPHPSSVLFLYHNDTAKREILFPLVILFTNRNLTQQKSFSFKISNQFF
jgi:hypothetical protein